jgi:hypothetical protein
VQKESTPLFAVSKMLCLVQKNRDRASGLQDFSNKVEGKVGPRITSKCSASLDLDRGRHTNVYIYI